MRKLELLAPHPAHLDPSAREIVPMGASFARNLRAIAEALFATDEPADPARIAWVVSDFGDFAARNARGRLIFTVSVWVLTWIAPLFIGNFGPLESLDLDKRARALDRIEQSFLGFAALGPKAILCMIWFEHPDTQRETRTEVTCLSK